MRCFYISILPHDQDFCNLSGIIIPPNSKRSDSVNYVVRPERDRDSLEEQSPKSQSQPWSVPISEKDTSLLVHQHKTCNPLSMRCEAPTLCGECKKRRLRPSFTERLPWISYGHGSYCIDWMQ